MTRIACTAPLQCPEERPTHGGPDARPDAAWPRFDPRQVARIGGGGRPRGAVHLVVGAAGAAISSPASPDGSSSAHDPSWRTAAIQRPDPAPAMSPRSALEERQIAFHVPKRSPDRVGVPGHSSVASGSTRSGTWNAILGCQVQSHVPKRTLPRTRKAGCAAPPAQGRDRSGMWRATPRSATVGRTGFPGLSWNGVSGSPDPRSVRRRAGPARTSRPRRAAWPPRVPYGADGDAGPASQPNRSSCRTVPSGLASMPRSRSALASSSANPW